MEAQQQEAANWTRIPAELQHQFFARAEEEAKRCRQVLLEKAKRLKELSRHVESSKMPEDTKWDRLRVAVVDGSNSPSTSERLGGRFGTYCAAYLIFEGKNVVDEGYSAGHIYHEQLGAPETTQKALNMLRVGLERDAALECLEKSVDLLLIDGSFFGFRADAHVVKDLDIGAEGFDSGVDLVYALRDKSRKLLESGKAVGIIKRTRNSALDGWLVYKHGDESRCINTNDKHILTSILPIGQWFAYEPLLGSPRAFNHFAKLRDTYRFLVLKEKKQLDMEHVMDAAKRKVERDVKDSLDMSGDAILRSARYHTRCCGAPPFEFEAKVGVDIEQCLAYFKAFHNPATGLPWPIDLADANASLPTGFNREFVEEIEARLIHDPEVQDKLELQEYFSYLNPQKEED